MTVLLRTSAALLAALVLGAPDTVFARDKPHEPDPVVWGALSGNAGCVIFADPDSRQDDAAGVAELRPGAKRDRRDAGKPGQPHADRSQGPHQVR